MASLFFFAVVEGEEPEPEPVPVPVGAVGTNVAEGLLKHELAAAFAADTVDGAAGLIVAFPAKLQLP